MPAALQNIGRDRVAREVTYRLSGDQLGLAYVDVADANGLRKLMTTIKLPALAGLMQSGAAGE